MMTLYRYMVNFFANPTTSVARLPGGVADRFALAGGPILGHPNGTLALDPTA